MKLAVGEWTTDGWPDWSDSGRRVEVETEEGGIVQGELTVDDFFFDGEDDVPVFGVLADDGTGHGFAGNKRWRFLMPLETKP